MKRFVVGLMTGVLVGAGFTSAQPLPILYDSRILARAPSGGIEANAALSDQLRVDILRVAKGTLQKDCSAENPVVTAVIAEARGSFTRRGAAQVAYLIGLCSTKRFSEAGHQGLAIYESNRLIAFSRVQITVTASESSELFGVRDMNLDGVDELGLVWWQYGGCCREGVLALIESRQGVTKALGEIRVGFTNGTAASDDRVQDWIVYVIKGQPPILIGVERLNQEKPTRLKLSPARLEIQSIPLR